MEFSVDKNTLAASVQRVSGAISEKSIASIGLQVESEVLTIASSDRVLAVYSNCPCRALERGTVFVPAKIFTDVVRELPQGEVTLKACNTYLQITAGDETNFNMKIPLLTDMEWRSKPNLSGEQALKLPAQQLSYMVEQIVFCIQQDSPRNYGAVGYLHKPSKSSLRLVGTDGFRLSLCEIKLDSATGVEVFPKGLCLSKRALSEIQRMCSEGFEIVNLVISEDNTSLKAYVEDYEIFILLSAVRYPSYQGVLPSKFDIEAGVARSTLQTVLKRVLLAADKTKALHMSFSENHLTLTAKTMGSSEGVERIKLGTNVPSEVSLTVNGKYLWEVLNTMSSEEVKFCLSGEEEPLMLLPLQEPNECHSKHVLVPIRESN